MTQVPPGTGATLAQVQELIDAAVDPLKKRLSDLEHHGGVVVPDHHVRYYGWADRRDIHTADFVAAATSQSNVGILPETDDNGYVFFAVPEPLGYPDGLFIQGNPNDAIFFFERLSETVNDNDGDPHIVGVSYNLQSRNIARHTLTLVYR